MDAVKRILWIDDDVNRFALKPYLDEFEDKGYEIVKAENPDEAAERLNLNPNFQGIIVDSAMPVGIVVDVAMPTGEDQPDFYGESKGGMQTGLVVLKRLMKNPALKDVKIVMFTIVDNSEVRAYCKQNGIPYLEKQKYLSDTFVDEIEKIISSSKE